MYCQGLGDCFLLTFPPATGSKPVRVMIDCGVLQHTANESKKMQQVVAHLQEECEGDIDLLIVTHEHWDHVAGFSHAKDVFEKKFTFDRVWLSWAENMADPDAKKLKAELGKKKAKLHAALDAVEKRVKATGQRSIRRAAPRRPRRDAAHPGVPRPDCRKDKEEGRRRWREDDSRRDNGLAPRRKWSRETSALPASGGRCPESRV